jgi:formylglycine-generating enzyme required for sulfatase activity
VRLVHQSPDKSLVRLRLNRPLPGDQGWGRDRRPVVNVSWHDANAYAAWLAQRTGNAYRLPTESEWEYAAQSGDKRDIWAGTSDETRLHEHVVYVANSQGRSATVGQDQARQHNAFGLYDMSGNVLNGSKIAYTEIIKGHRGMERPG